MPTAEIAPLSVPRDLPLDHQLCTQDGKFALSLSITWTSRALKQVPGLLGRCGEELYLGGGLRGTQGTPLHTGSSGGSYSRTESPGRKGSCLHLNCSASGPTPGRSWRAGAGLSGKLGEAGGGGRGKKRGREAGEGIYVNSQRERLGEVKPICCSSKVCLGLCVCWGQMAQGWVIPEWPSCPSSVFLSIAGPERLSFREEYGWRKAKDTAEGRKHRPAALSINMI